MQRYRGVVESGVAGLVRLVRDGDIVATVHERGKVTAHLDDGSTLVLAIDGSTTIEGDGKTTRGAWSDLRDTAHGHLFEREVVQPFAEVELVHVAFEAGADIIATGAKTDVEFTDEGGPRESPTGIPVLKATWVATGPHAEKAYEALVAKRHRDEPPKPVEPGDPGDPATSVGLAPETMLALVVGGTILGLALMMGVRRGLISIAVAAVGALLASQASRRTMPALWTRTAPLATSNAPMTILMITAVLACGLVSFGVGRVALWWLLAWSVVPIGLVVTIVVASGKQAGLLGELARATSRPIDAAVGAWVLIEGTLSRGNHNGGNHVLVHASTRTQLSYSRRGADELLGTDVQGDKTFVVTTTDGDVTIDREDIVWTSTCATGSKDRDRGQVVTDELQLLAGGKVAACGKLERRAAGGFTLRSSGTRPVVVFATSKNGRPHAYVRAIRASRLLSFAILGLTEVGIVVTAYYERR